MSRDVVCDAVPARNIPHRPRQHQPYAHFFPKELDTGVAAAPAIIGPGSASGRGRAADVFGLPDHPGWPPGRSFTCTAVIPANAPAPGTWVTSAAR